MIKKLLKRANVWTTFQTRPVKQTTLPRPFDARVDLRSTHHQLKSEVRVGKAVRSKSHELKHHINVLRLQSHALFYIRDSRITNG
jgi:hypothetical protein